MKIHEKILSVLNLNIFALLLINGISFAQESVLLVNKPGTFTIAPFDTYPPGDNGFTKKDLNDFYGNLTKIINLSKTIPMFVEQKGFNCRVVTAPGDYVSFYKYGIPADLIFLLQTWSIRNGKEVLHKIEPPQYRFVINDLNPFDKTAYGTSEPANPKNGFDRNKYKAAAEKLSELFWQPGEKHTIGSGIDVYGEDKIVLYNPERPKYWSQVTIKEAYELTLDYNKNNPDEAASSEMVKILETEYSKYTEEEKNSYAYFAPPDKIFNLTGDSTLSKLPLLRVNSAYWNKNLPKSAIQFITFKMPADREEIKRVKDQLLERNDGTYYEYYFMEGIDLNSYAKLIER